MRGLCNACFERGELDEHGLKPAVCRWHQAATIKLASQINIVLGAVRFVQADSLKQQLDQGHVVLLSSLAYSAAGEVLNCNSYDVAVHAAVDLKADKFICVTDGVSEMGLPQWLPLCDAEELIGERAAALAQVQSSVQCSSLQDCPKKGWPARIWVCK